MNGYQYILVKQTEWAKNHDLDLRGSKGNRGRLAYTTDLKYNLFQPLLPEVRTSFSTGDGGELSSSDFPGKMKAYTHPRHWPLMYFNTGSLSQQSL